MSSTRLYLRNLPSNVKRDEVYNYLERFGQLTELKIIASESTSYGFVQFSSEKDAQCVLETFRGRLFLGHRTTIEPARPMRKDRSADTSRDLNTRSRSRPPKPSTRLHQRYPVLVDNLPRHICWQELKDFGRLAGGLVAYCDIESHKKGRGFIEYLSQEDAEEAVRVLDGQNLGGRCVQVSASRTRRSSRSSSPTRRTKSERLSDSLSLAGENPLSSLFHGPASRSSSLRSPQRSSSIDGPTSASYSDDTSGLSVLSQVAESYRAGIYHDRTPRGTTLLPFASSESAVSGREGLLMSDYDYDAYLRLSYDRCLGKLHGCSA